MKKNIINIDVNGTDINIISGHGSTSGSQMVDECIFTFSDDWNGLTKTAVFGADIENLYPVLLNNDVCEIPNGALLESGKIYIGVVGVLKNLDITTRVRRSVLVKYDVLQGAKANMDLTSEDYTSLYEQITGVLGRYATAEALRVNSEQLRISAEQSRVTAENTRASKETERQTAETARATAETDRANAESLRVTAESGRASAETSRVASETDRVTAENLRVSAESGRVSAENSRVAAENERRTANGTTVQQLTNLLLNSDFYGDIITMTDVSHLTADPPQGLENARGDTYRALRMLLYKLLELKEDIDNANGGSITVDSALSDTSENPVQNKVVKSAIDDKQGALTAGDNITIENDVISATEKKWQDCGTITTDIPLSAFNVVDVDVPIGTEEFTVKITYPIPTQENTGMDTPPRQYLSIRGLADNYSGSTFENGFYLSTFLTYTSTLPTTVRYYQYHCRLQGSRWESDCSYVTSQNGTNKSSITAYEYLNQQEAMYAQSDMTIHKVKLFCLSGQVIPSGTVINVCAYAPIAEGVMNND